MNTSPSFVTYVTLLAMTTMDVRLLWPKGRGDSMGVGCVLLSRRKKIRVINKGGVRGGLGFMGEAPIHVVVDRGEVVIAYLGGKRKGRGMQTPT
jgi:hypothetical protein